ncbi:hypothetical protein U1Q18_023949 [Sarracenia purpurea var. burkii]
MKIRGSPARRRGGRGRRSRGPRHQQQPGERSRGREGFGDESGGDPAEVIPYAQKREEGFDRFRRIARRFPGLPHVVSGVSPYFRLLFPGSPPAPNLALVRFRLLSYHRLLLKVEGQHGFCFGPSGFPFLR